MSIKERVNVRECFRSSFILCLVMQLESLSDSIHLIFVSFNETVLSVLCWGSNGIEGNAFHFPSSNTWWWGRWMLHLYLLPRSSLIPRDVFLRNSIFSREARMSCELSKSLIETRNVSREERKKSCNRIHMSLCVPSLSLHPPLVPRISWQPMSNNELTQSTKNGQEGSDKSLFVAES